jgi:RimJ/RimL family protein N-acetyltransferase
LRTPRLLLRPWSPEDAEALLPVLDANVAHIGPWIPAHVSTPVPLPQLRERLANFSADFSADRAYRYAVLSPDESRVLGEADMFPRSSRGRVPLADADHVELGYWIAADATGQGFATEAVGALVAAAEALPGMTHAEIRCNPANAPSAGVARRLGFERAGVDGDVDVWRKRFGRARNGVTTIS